MLDGMIDVAYLRVYRPAEEVRLPPVSPVGARPRLGAATLITESAEADAWEIDWNGRQWRCPRTPRRRMLETVVAFDRATSRFGASLVAPDVVDSARRELRRIRAGAPEPSSVLVSAWHPPLRWFLGFVPTDLGEAMLLRSDLDAVLGRVSACVDAMRRLGLPAALSEEIAGLAEWMSGFRGEAAIELDYRQVGRRVGAIEADSTVERMHEAVASLIAGNIEEATRNYAAALALWAPAQLLAVSS